MIDILRDLVGEKLVLSDLPKGLRAQPNGLLLQQGKKPDDLFGKVFFRTMSEGKTEYKVLPVVIPAEYGKMITEELLANKEFVSSDDAALQHVAVEPVMRSEKLLLQLVESGIKPPGAEYPVPWVTVPAWDVAAKAMPRSTGNNIIIPANFRGQQMYVRSMGQDAPQKMNIAIYELGDNHPTRSWVYDQDGPILQGKPVEPEVWLKHMLFDEHRSALNPHKSTPEQVIVRRLSLLTDALEEAFEYFGQDIYDDEYTSIVNSVMEKLFPPTVVLPKKKVSFS